MAVKNLTTDNFEKEVLEAEKPAIVDFGADWCMPCKMAEPVLEELSDEYKDKVIIGKIDIGKDQTLAQKYGVMSIPTVIIFKDGKEVNRQVGFPGKEGYQAMLDKVTSNE